jgi:hypothetical protein
MVYVSNDDVGKEFQLLWNSHNELLNRSLNDDSKVSGFLVFCYYIFNALPQPYLLTITITNPINYPNILLLKSNKKNFFYNF